MPPAMPVRVRGKEYPSVEAAARAEGMSYAATYYRLARGNPDDIGVPYRRGGRRHSRRVKICGVWYDSVAEAARVLGCDRGTVRRRAEEIEEVIWPSD